MKAIETWAWNFEPSKPQDTSEVQCLECKQWSPLTEWTEGEVGCETCGDHAAMVCPKCGEMFDHVNQDDPLPVRNES